MPVHGYSNICSCGIGTPNEYWESDKTSTRGHCRICAKHDQAKRFSSTKDTVFKRKREDAYFVEEMERYKPDSLSGYLAKYGGIGYYKYIHPFISTRDFGDSMPLRKRSYGDLESNVPSKYSRVLGESKEMSGGLVPGNSSWVHFHKPYFKKKNKLRKAIQAQILRTVYPTFTDYFEVSANLHVPVNLRYIVDLHSAAFTSGNNVESFMSYNNLTNCVTRCYGTTNVDYSTATLTSSAVANVVNSFPPPLDLGTGVAGTPSALGRMEAYWFLGVEEYIEITNISNEPAYIRMHHLYCTEHAVDDKPLKLAYFYLKEYEPHVQVNTSLAGVTTYNDRRLSITEVQDGTVYSYNQMFLDLFKDAEFQRALKQSWTWKSTGEIKLGPQGQYKYQIKRKKPFLFRPRDWAANGSGAAQTNETVTYDANRHCTQTLLMDVVGETARGATNKANYNQVLAAPVTLSVNRRFRFKLCKRGNNLSTTLYEGRTDQSVDTISYLYGYNENQGFAQD